MGPKTHHVQTQSYVLPPNWVLFPSQRAAPPSIHLGKAGTGSHAGNSNFLTVLRSPHPTHHPRLEMPKYLPTFPALVI